MAGAARGRGAARRRCWAAGAGRPGGLAVQAVGPRIETWFDRPVGAEPRETRLVVIGEAGLDRAAITAALAP